jgi:hypothetical protein
MKIDLKRIAMHLHSAGFEVGFIEQGASHAVFVRKHADGLFARMSIDQGFQRGGRVGDLVGASVACAITPGRTALKGMAEVLCLTEIASEPETGWTALADKAAGLEWESKFCAVAPTRANEFAARVGPTLLASTKQARDASNQYLERCRLFGPTTQEMLLSMKARMSGRQESECQRIMKRPIICIPNGKEFYDVAVHAIALYAGEVEGDPHWFEGKKPDFDDDRGPMIRLQFIASKLAMEPGW